MSISCDFYEDEDSFYIGEIDFFICDTEQKCHACGTTIKKNEWFYKAYSYQLDEDDEECNHNEIIHCERCGDMAANLLDLDFSFDWYENPVAQWKEYLEETSADNNRKQTYG